MVAEELGLELPSFLLGSDLVIIIPAIPAGLTRHCSVP